MLLTQHPFLWSNGPCLEYFSLWFVYSVTRSVSMYWLFVNINKFPEADWAYKDKIFVYSFGESGSWHCKSLVLVRTHGACQEHEQAAQTTSPRKKLEKGGPRPCCCTNLLFKLFYFTYLGSELQRENLPSTVSLSKWTEWLRPSQEWTESLEKDLNPLESRAPKHLLLPQWGPSLQHMNTGGQTTSKP